MPKFSDEEKAKAAQREAALRKSVYPGLIRKNRISALDAQRQIEIMREIEDDYTHAGERLAVLQEELERRSNYAHGLRVRIMQVERELEHEVAACANAHDRIRELERLVTKLDSKIGDILDRPDADSEAADRDGGSR